MQHKLLTSYAFSMVTRRDSMKAATSAKLYRTDLPTFEYGIPLR
ncbi:MAG: hypothetical protein PHW09_06640 [Desulfovibrio desulfuricans]|nr:hypothetical protein [Desulfovibrio desulfuricans]